MQSKLLIQSIRRASSFCLDLPNLKIVNTKDGNCMAKCVIQKDDTNPVGSMHGGFAAILMENVSNIGLSTIARWEEPSPTITMNISYLKAAKLGEEVSIDSKLLKVGKNMAFVNVEIRNSANDLLVKAEQIKLKS